MLKRIRVKVTFILETDSDDAMSLHGRLTLGMFTLNGLSAIGATGRTLPGGTIETRELGPRKHHTTKEAGR